MQIYMHSRNPMNSFWFDHETYDSDVALIMEIVQTKRNQVDDVPQI